HCVCEAEHEQVLHGFLAKEVIDSVDPFLGEVTVERVVQRACAREVVAERLLDDDAVAALPSGQARIVEPAHDQREVVGRHGEVERDVLAAVRARVTQRAREPRVGLRVAVLAAHESEASREALERVGVGVCAPLRQLVAEIRAERVVVPFAASDADEVERLVEQSAAVEVVQRRQELPPREVARHAEDHEAARRILRAHVTSSPRTACPPKRFLSMARSFEPKSSPPWLAKRIISAVLMTGAGTPRSIDSIAAQRPSPESATYGAARSSPAWSRSTSAARSSSQLRTTLPWRHISAIAARSRSRSVRDASSAKPSAYACIIPYSMP